MEFVFFFVKSTHQIQLSCSIGVGTDMKKLEKPIKNYIFGGERRCNKDKKSRHPNDTFRSLDTEFQLFSPIWVRGICDEHETKLTKKQLF